MRGVFNFVVGDTAYIRMAYGNDVEKGEVVKISPSGQISVKIKRGHGTFTDRFMPDGREIGSGHSYHRARLIDPETYDAIKDEVAEKHLRAKLHGKVDALARLVRRGEWAEIREAHAEIAALLPGADE